MNRINRKNAVSGKWFEDAGDVPGTEPVPQRLQKILSANGITSRRDAERMIMDGRVTVNGSPAHVGQCAILGLDEIAINGVQLEPRREFIYIMLNKPRGYITTQRDERGRKTVMSLLDGLCVRVFPVGRLDMDSEGLLLLTNDGQFANAVAHPSSGKKKTYEVNVRGDAAEAVKMLNRPILIDTRDVKAESAVLSERTTDGGVLHISIVEGRNRQIRKMCAACGLKVLSLKRL